MNENDIPPCLITIDKQGRWFHKGLEMIRREFIRHFYEHMVIDSRGRYVIEMGGERCFLEVEDTPFVIWKATVGNQGHGDTRVVLALSDDSQEDLNPETLFVGENNVLYCRVKNGIFPARFDRPAYYQLAEHVGEEGGNFFLEMKGERYFIRREGA